MDDVLKGQIEGHIPSSDKPPPGTQVWKDGEGVDGNDLVSELLEGLEEESSPCLSIPARDKTKGIGRRAWKKR